MTGRIRSKYALENFNNAMVDSNLSKVYKNIS